MIQLACATTTHEHILKAFRATTHNLLAARNNALKPVPKPLAYAIGALLSMFYLQADAQTELKIAPTLVTEPANPGNRAQSSPGLNNNKAQKHNAKRKPPATPQIETRLKLDVNVLGGIKPSEDEATYLSADRMFTNGKEETFLQGDVEIRRKNVRIASDAIQYSPITDKALAEGNITIEMNNMVLQAPSGEIKVGTGETRLNNPSYELGGIALGKIKANNGQMTGTMTSPSSPSNPSNASNPTFNTAIGSIKAPASATLIGKGSAESLEFDGISTLTLKKPNYTVCEVPSANEAEKGDWHVSAQELQIDQTEEVGRAKDAKVVFKGVPILAAPYFSFPTSDRRKSGFLPPSVGTVSNSGLEFTQPYYWNIAPDKDLTLFPTVITGRGFQLGSQARYLGEFNRGEIKFDALPDDKKNGLDRNALSLNHQYNQGAWFAGLNVNQVSDDQYFVDFSRTQAVASQRVLLREGFAGWRNDALLTSIRVVSHQTLQLPNDIILEPYDRLPEIGLEVFPTAFAWGFGSVQSSYTDFAAPNGSTGTAGTAGPARVEGKRMVARGKVEWPIQQNAFAITPALAVQASQYQLQNQTAGLTAKPGSVIPTASLDGTLYFDRQTEWFGKAVNQSLEPRLFYLYTPFRDQSDQPLFDTTVTDQNLSRIFADNRYAGRDRVGDANQITVAVTSRFTDANTREELFSLTGGQRINLSTPKLLLTGLESPITQDSDFFANARGRIAKDWFLETTSQFSSESGRHQRGNFMASYAPSVGKQLNLAYRYTRNAIDQFDISGQWPLSKRFSGVGRFNYSVLDRRLIEAVAGLEYAEGCWAFRVVAQRFATAPLLETSSLFLQLELNGLGRIGSNPLDLLSRKVPGYTPFSYATAPNSNDSSNTP